MVKGPRVWDPPQAGWQLAGGPEAPGKPVGLPSASQARADWFLSFVHLRFLLSLAPAFQLTETKQV